MPLGAKTIPRLRHEGHPAGVFDFLRIANLHEGRAQAPKRRKDPSTAPRAAAPQTTPGRTVRASRRKSKDARLRSG